MAYSIEKPRNPNLEDTAIPNLFITDFLPDVPDGDFVKVYIYAYMCCRQGIDLTHSELAERLGIAASKITEAWKYFSERCIVKLTPCVPAGTDYNIEFVDVKGVLYGGEAANGNKDEEASVGLGDFELAALFQKINVLYGDVSLSPGDMKRVISWMDEDGATPDVIGCVWEYSSKKGKAKAINYVSKIVSGLTEKGIHTAAEAEEELARYDARNYVHKKLKEALGLRYSDITESEERIFNIWLDDYGYNLEQLLELAARTAGTKNKVQYLDGIIRREREAEGKPTVASVRKMGRVSPADRKEYYQNERQKNEDIAASNLKEVYSAIPEVERLDKKIVSVNTKLYNTLASSSMDKEGARNRLKEEIETIKDLRKGMLADAGFPGDYTDVHYTCPRCSDSGILENGSVCDCFPKRQ